MRKVIYLMTAITIIVIAYYFLSIHLSPSNSFIRYRSGAPPNKIKSFEPIILYKTNDDNCSQLKLLVSEKWISKEFGLFPIGYNFRDTTYFYLDVQIPLKELNSGYTIELSGYPKMSKYSIQQRIYKINDTVQVVIRNKESELQCQMKILIKDKVEAF
jgi:hypothetical protein